MNLLTACRCTVLLIVAVLILQDVFAPLSLSSSPSLAVVLADSEFDATNTNNELLQQSTTTTKKRKILSFGGNGMIGSETLRILLDESKSEYDITLVSRGSWPYDSSTRIQPFVSRTIECDREDHGLLRDCPDLMDDISTTDEYYAVLDFSGYHPTWIQDTIDILKGKARVYIYVSTDSVYEVCDGLPYLQSNRKSMETDSIRPSDKFRRQELRLKDEYGDDKLAGEDVLIKQQQQQNSSSGIPYVILRFADVIGPRDNTGRFLRLFTYLKFVNVVPSIPDTLTLPSDVVEATSITYVKDAAKSIVNVIHSERSTWNDIYNIACKDIFNVTAAITSIGQMMGHHHSIVPKKISSSPEKPTTIMMDVYPSVTRGPIEITKAKEKINFVPTAQHVALMETIKWYNEYYEQNEDFQEEVLEELIDMFVSTKIPDFNSSDDDDDVDIDNAIDEFLEEIRQHTHRREDVEPPTNTNDEF